MDYSSSSSTNEEKTSLFALRLASAAVLPTVLKCAIELDLLELIKKAGPGEFVSPAELAAQITTTNAEAPAMLDRILRLLAANGILKCHFRDLPHGGVECLYSLGPVCKYLTRNDVGASMAPMVLMNNNRTFMEAWYHLKDAIVEGGVQFKKAFGMNTFEYSATDPRFNKLFNQTMCEQSIVFMKRILEIYKGFEGVKSLVDVGGGIGASLRMITSKYPSIQAFNFDLPHVIQNAPSLPGVTHVAGDMFVSVPKAEAIFMKWICHDWSDTHCKRLLKNCYEALPKNGKVIIAETTLPDDPNSWSAASPLISADVIMLAVSPGGKERAEKEFQTLAIQAGFKQFIQVCRSFNIWIMELHKRTYHWLLLIIFNLQRLKHLLSTIFNFSNKLKYISY